MVQKKKFLQIKGAKDKNVYRCYIVQVYNDSKCVFCINSMVQKVVILGYVQKIIVCVKSTDNTTTKNGSEKVVQFIDSLQTLRVFSFVLSLV